MNTDTTARIVATAQESAGIIALNEIQKIDPNARQENKLDSTAAVIRLSIESRQLIQEFQRVPPIFLRHLFPIHCMLPWSDPAADLSPLYDLVSIMEKGKRASIQARFSFSRGAPDERQEDIPFPYTLIHQLMDSIESRGLPYSKRDPQQILSLYFDREMLYAGLSSPEDNLSSYNGGCRMFRREKEQISRAEFKLLEALECFHIPLPANGRALDLGASPGGWTKVLLDRGFHVTAVDPAALDERLAGHPALFHFRDVSQNYRGKPGSVDLLVNDMRMDPMQSAHIMREMRPLLRIEGQAIMTLKLPKKQWYKQTQKALHFLGTDYRVERARQLFHNRSEVTVWLKNKER